MPSGLRGVFGGFSGGGVGVARVSIDAPAQVPVLSHCRLSGGQSSQYVGSSWIELMTPDSGGYSSTWMNRIA